MKKIVYLLAVTFFLGVLFGNAKAGDDATYYARCNLKVIKGNYITWVNWQSTEDYLPVGTAFKVKLSGNKATLTDLKSGSSYTLEIGAAGDEYLAKFVTRNKVGIWLYPKDVQENIKDTVARIGMTKEQVYIAMGPPAWVTSGDTNKKTYENIMGANLWVYKRRRFSKNIGVEFNPSSGIVDRTEGIWK